MISWQVIKSIVFFFLRVGVQVAGGQIWMTTSHMSVTVSRELQGFTVIYLYHEHTTVSLQHSIGCG